MKNLYLIILFFIASCAPGFKKLPEGPISHQLIALAKVNDGIRVRGFSGATPAKTAIMCTMGQASAKTESLDDGSFDLKIITTNVADYAELIFNVNGKDHVASYQVKQLDIALNNIAREPLTTGKEIDELSFIDQKVLVLSSNAASVGIYEISDEWSLGKAQTTILLNPKADVNVAARTVVGFKNFALVPFFLTHELALLDLSQGKLMSKTRLNDAQGKPFIFKNEPPLMVNNPIDADGLGKKSEISDSLARNAETVFALDDEHFLVSFTNQYQFLDGPNKSVMGPGIVALVTIKDGVISSQDIKILKFKNPMYFLAQDEKNIWITCPGPWVSAEKGVYKSADAGMVKLLISDDKKSFSIQHEIALKDFSPAPPSIVNHKIIIPHSQHDEIAVIDDTATEIAKADIKRVQFPRPLSFSFASFWHDDIVMLGDDGGTLVAYSLKEGFFPFPFVEPINMSPKAKELAPRVSKLYFRHIEKKKEIKDLSAGYSAWAISSIQARIFPLDFLAVFGP